MLVKTEQIGPLTLGLRVKQTLMSHPRSPNHYITSRHDFMPGLIGLRYLGQNRAHAERQFQLAADRDRAALAASGDCVA